MFLFSNRIYLSQDKEKVKNDLTWTSDLIKKSEKEPNKTLENLVDSIRTKKEFNKINQDSLDEKRKNKELPITEKQFTEKDRSKSPEELLEKQMDNDDNRNSEYYNVDTIPLFVKDVYPKQKERAKKNEEFYKKNKDKLIDGDVVSASKKNVIFIPVKSANMVEDIYINDCDPKENDDDSIAFDDSELRDKKNDKKKD